MPDIRPFTVTVVRNSYTWQFDVRGTHDMVYRLCERIDDGRDCGNGRAFGPLYFDACNRPRNGQPTQYDERAGAWQPMRITSK